MASDEQRLDEIRVRVAEVLRRDPNWQLLTDDFPWMDAAINRLLAVNERQAALLAERDAEIARLVEAGQALIAKSPCFVTIRPGGNDIECCQFCLTDNAHAPGCEWVGQVAALAARGGAS